MKITHIMLVEKFTEPYIEFINNNFNESDHQFLVIGKINDLKISKRHNVIRYSKNVKNVFLIMKTLFSSEKIIVHGLYSPHITLMYYLFPNLLKKSSWVVWGGDLYYYKNREKNYKTLMYEHIRKKVISNFSELITLTEGDYLLAKQWYNVKGRYSMGIYINPVNIEMIEGIELKELSHSYVNIMIGNSADRSNNHVEVLNTLEKFKNEDINIYMPLSYGDPVYADEVSKLGYEIFGSRFYPIREFLPPEKYFEFLSSMDIAIFAHNRQQAIFNISILAYLNKKIFLKTKISTWDYFKNELELDINAYEELNSDTFNSLFIDFPSVDNSKKIRHLFDENYAKTLWERLF